MKKPIIFGIFAVAVYYLATTAFVLYALSCSTIYCSFFILAPVLPWPLLLEPLFSTSLLTYFFATVLNAIITFFIGRYIGTVVSHRQDRRLMN